LLIPGVSFQSRLEGVDQEVRVAVADKDGPLFLATSFSAPCVVLESFSASEAFGVGHGANSATACRSPPPLLIRPSSCFRSPLSGPPVGVRGVGHEVQPLSEVRRTEARSAGIRYPHGVTLSFQVRANMVEPSKAVFRANLFAKERDRAADTGEMEETRP